jgi:hypothetical protein
MANVLNVSAPADSAKHESSAQNATELSKIIPYMVIFHNFAQPPQPPQPVPQHKPKASKHS